MAGSVKNSRLSLLQKPGMGSLAFFASGRSEQRKRLGLTRIKMIRAAGLAGGNKPDKLRPLSKTL